VILSVSEYVSFVRLYVAILFFASLFVLSTSYRESTHQPTNEQRLGLHLRIIMIRSTRLMGRPRREGGGKMQSQATHLRIDQRGVGLMNDATNAQNTAWALAGPFRTVYVARAARASYGALCTVVFGSCSGRTEFIGTNPLLGTGEPYTCREPRNGSQVTAEGVTVNRGKKKMRLSMVHAQDSTNNLNCKGIRSCVKCPY
jgi:hypothetical protein